MKVRPSFCSGLGVGVGRELVKKVKWLVSVQFWLDYGGNRLDSVAFWLD